MVDVASASSTPWSGFIVHGRSLAALLCAWCMLSCTLSRQHIGASISLLIASCLRYGALFAFESLSTVTSKNERLREDSAKRGLSPLPKTQRRSSRPSSSP